MEGQRGEDQGRIREIEGQRGEDQGKIREMEGQRGEDQGRIREMEGQHATATHQASSPDYLGLKEQFLP